MSRKKTNYRRLWRRARKEIVANHNLMYSLLSGAEVLFENKEKLTVEEQLVRWGDYAKALIEAKNAEVTAFTKTSEQEEDDDVK